MPTAILNLVKLNENVDYTFLIPLAILYILIFWLIVSIWVYIDSKRRIKRKRYRVLIFLLNLFFGLPFMLLYLLARPYDSEEVDEISGGGVNVPIINFVGKEGIVMALELKISPTSLVNKDSVYDANMRIGVNIETPQLVDIQKVEAPQVGKNENVEIKKNDKKSFIQLLKNIFEFKGEDDKTTSVGSEESSSLTDESKKNSVKQKKKSNKKRNR